MTYAPQGVQGFISQVSQVRNKLKIKNTNLNIMTINKKRVL